MCSNELHCQVRALSAPPHQAMGSTGQALLRLANSYVPSTENSTRHRASRLPGKRMGEHTGWAHPASCAAAPAATRGSQHPTDQARSHGSRQPTPTSCLEVTAEILLRILNSGDADTGVAPEGL